MLISDRARQETLYGDFIEQASKTYADALEHNIENAVQLAPLSTLVNRIRLFAPEKIVETSEAVLFKTMEAYLAPNIKVRDFHDPGRGRNLDILREFSAACRKELQSMSLAKE